MAPVVASTTVVRLSSVAGVAIRSEEVSGASSGWGGRNDGGSAVLHARPAERGTVVGSWPQLRRRDGGSVVQVETGSGAVVHGVDADYGTTTRWLPAAQGCKRGVNRWVTTQPKGSISFCSLSQISTPFYLNVSYFLNWLPLKCESYSTFIMASPFFFLICFLLFLFQSSSAFSSFSHCNFTFKFCPVELSVEGVCFMFPFFVPIFLSDLSAAGLIMTDCRPETLLLVVNAISCTAPCMKMEEGQRSHQKKKFDLSYK